MFAVPGAEERATNVLATAARAWIVLPGAGASIARPNFAPKNGWHVDFAAN